MFLSQKGYTVVELVIVVAMIAIIAAIAIPSISSMLSSSQEKEAARGVASALQAARSGAISYNLEHRVVFDVDQSKYQLQQGDKSSGSGIWTPVHYDWISFGNNTVMRSTTTCDSTSDIAIHFNPNGTSQTGYICVMTADLEEKFKVGVSHAATGRIKIE